jgi:hypothetical protein
MCNLSEVMKKEQKPITQLEFEIILEEITEYLIEENIILGLKIYNQKFEDAAKKRDSIQLFIKDTTAIIVAETKMRYQRIFLRLNQINDTTREMIIEHLKENNGQI